MDKTYPYAYKLPASVKKLDAELLSTAGQLSTSLYKQGIYCAILAQGREGTQLGRSLDQKFETLIRQPIELASSRSITSVRFLAQMYERGRLVQVAKIRIPFVYVEKFTRVRVVYSPLLRAAALKAIARAYR